MHINWLKREIIFKLVYYGAGLSGKTTNLEYIHRKLSPEVRGDLVSLKTTQDRTLYFDFMQLELGKIKGKRPRFHLYTIPGQIIYSRNRSLVIRGADAFIFVVDSQRDRIFDNLASLMDLEEKLVNDRKSLETVPWVIQYNKRDLPTAEDIDTMQRKYNFLDVPYFEAVATEGTGVFDTLKHVIRITMEKSINKIDRP